MQDARSTRCGAWFRLSAVAAALLAGWGAALGQEATPSPDEIRKDLYTPDSRIAIGLGVVGPDNRRFGQQRGLTEGGAYGLLDIDFVRRDDSTGTWLKLDGRNLGLDTRELRFTHERQGDWAYTLQGSQFSRREPLVVLSGLQGGGSGSQVVSASAPKRELNLKIDHDIVGFSARKFIVGGLDLQLSFKQDDSQGERLFGRGTGNVMEFLTEPIARTTRQWQAVLSYANRQLQFSGGYSGSSYDNQVPVLQSSGGNTANSAFGALWAQAMPPSNTAHQVFLSGGINLNAGTRSSFKLSRSVALQNERFDPQFIRLAGAPASLNGKVITSLAMVDLSARPRPELDIVAALRLEDRDDRTPVARYLAETLPTVGGNFGTAGATGLNKPRSLQQLKATLDAGWQFDGGWRLVGGLEQEDLARSVSEKYRRMGYRETSSELSSRLELKRSMSETLNGSLALLRSVRSGADYLPDTYDPNALTNQMASMMWSDRNRDRLRLSADWLPDERWAVQLLADGSVDHYSGRTLGLRKGSSRLYSVDANFRINDRWNLSTWATHETQDSEQADHTDRVGNVALGFDTLWAADIRHTSRALGLSLKGQARANLALGADFSGSLDQARYGLRKTGGAGTAAINSLPGLHYRQQTLKLFADLALPHKAGVRIDVALDRRRNNDWTWDNWVYNGAPAIAAAARNSDGSTVRNPAAENVRYLAITYHQRWR